MLWPLILPLKITCWVLLLTVVGLTIFASPRSWSRGKTFLIYSSFAILAFIPLLSGVIKAVDSFRFGDFHYSSHDDVPDFRSQRYLPEAATDIQMRKHGNGYRARYTISASDFHSYLDDLWKQYSEQSAVARGGFGDEGRSFEPEVFHTTFKGLGWNCPSGATIYHSPSEADGGGATYFFDSDAGLAFQRTGFW